MVFRNAAQTGPSHFIAWRYLVILLICAICLIALTACSQATDSTSEISEPQDAQDTQSQEDSSVGHVASPIQDDSSSDEDSRDRAEIAATRELQILVLNGTGVEGAAATVRDDLKDMG